MTIPILLVEDDEKLRRVLATWIVRAGYHVTQAADGETAIRLLERQQFAVVITDLVLGAVDGLAVLEAAALASPRPAVILMTGYGTLETALAALRLGAFDYLLKPCKGDDLLARLAAASSQVEADRRVTIAIQMLTGAGAPPAAVAFSSGYAGAPRYPADRPAAVGWRSTAGDTPAPVDRLHPGQPGLPDQPLRIGDLEIGQSRLQVKFKGKTTPLTRIEHALLRYLAERPGRVCYYRDLAYASHGVYLDDGEARDLLRTHLQNLKTKLDRSYFLAEPGSGYILVPPCNTGCIN